ncbi:hypothetical protein KBZ94_32485 [Streptomyces sp. RM72]|nr:hypothetical protein [Streptomyces sp. RM72]
MLTARQDERLPQWLDAVRTPERFSPNRPLFVAELTNFMSVGLPMTTDVRRMIEADVIALFSRLGD